MAEGAGGGAAAPAAVATLTAAMRAGSIERERTSAGAAQSCDVCALFGHARRAHRGGMPAAPATTSGGFVGICADKPAARPDVRVARAAADQWGVLSLDELFACGLSRGAV